MTKVSKHSLSVHHLLGKLKLPAVLLLLLFGGDLSFDIKERDKPEHIAIELVIYLTLAYMVLIGYRFYKLDKKALDAARRDIDATQHKLANAEQRNQRLQAGINASMQNAFAQWKLTKAESEVALLVIKGFSLAEIAELRGTSERTTRDQSASIYHKAKLKNRIELTAYFVEDLL
jgi:DNA-binding CsgD family transcriptional regulator